MTGELWLGKAQIGKETTYGVAVAASRLVYLNGNPVMTRTRAARARQVATGTRNNQRAFSLGPSEVGASFDIPLSASEIGEWAGSAIQGGVSATTPTGATNGRQYQFVGGASNLDSMTVEYNDGAAAFRGYGVYVNEFRISGDANGVQTATVQLFGVDRELHALTGSLASRTPTIIEGYETICAIDAFGTYGRTQIPDYLQKWDITYTNGLMRKYLANNRNRMNRAVLAPMGLKAALTVEAASSQAVLDLANWDASTRQSLLLRFGYNATNPIAGDTAVNNVKTGTLTGTPTGGTFKVLAYGIPSGNNAITATGAQVAAAIQTAVQAVLGTDYTFSGSGSGGGPFIITLTGAQAGRNAPIFTTDASLLTGGSSPTVAWAETTPGYEACEGITLEIPGFWEAADTSQTDQGTRMYAMSMDYLNDNTNAFPFRMTVLAARSTLF